MIGFLIDSQTLATLEAGFAAAFQSRNVPQYLTLGAIEITQGEHAGQWFIPFDNSALTQPLWGNRTLPDFHEFEAMIGMLGGLEARIEITLPETTEQ